MASRGLRAVGTDYDKQKIQNLRRGNLTFEEAGLKELYQEACRNETIIVVESTVYPGTVDRFVRPIVEQRNKENEAGYGILFQEGGSL